MSSRLPAVPATEARARIAELVNRAAYAGDRVPISRHGRVVAALVSAEDLERLERLDAVTVGFAPTSGAATEDVPAAARARRRR